MGDGYIYFVELQIKRDSTRVSKFSGTIIKFDTTGNWYFNNGPKTVAL